MLVMAAIFAMSSRPDLGGPDRLVAWLSQWAAGRPLLQLLVSPVLLAHRYETWIGHLLEYALLALALAWGIRHQWPALPGLWIIAWSAALLYGLSDEWHQSFVPGRTPDFWDLVTDAIGAAVALAVARYIANHRT